MLFDNVSRSSPAFCHLLLCRGKLKMQGDPAWTEDCVRGYTGLANARTGVCQRNTIACGTRSFVRSTAIKINIKPMDSFEIKSAAIPCAPQLDPLQYEVEELQTAARSSMPHTTPHPPSKSQHMLKAQDDRHSSAARLLQAQKNGFSAPRIELGTFR